MDQVGRTGRRSNVMTSDEILAEYPKLAGTEWQPTSLPDSLYNCVAWALAEDKTRWWEPYYFEEPQYYWPTDCLPRTHPGTVEAYTPAFKVMGFSNCEDGAIEEDFEKIAIYASEGDEFMHVARQLENGHWTSKLDCRDDIQHQTPEGVENEYYGKVVRYMKRPRHNAKS